MADVVEVEKTGVADDVLDMLIQTIFDKTSFFQYGGATQSRRSPKSHYWRYRRNKTKRRRR